MSAVLFVTCLFFSAASNINRDGPSRTLSRPKGATDEEDVDGSRSASPRSPIASAAAVLPPPQRPPMRRRGKSPMSNGPSQAEELLQRLQGTAL